MVFSNERKTVDINVKKVLESNNTAAKLFNYTAEYKLVEDDNYKTARNKIIDAAVRQQANRIVLDGFHLSTKNISQAISEVKKRSGGKLLQNIEVHWLNTVFIYRKEE